MSPAVRIQLVEDREGARIAAAVADRVWSMTAMVPTEIVIAAVHAGGYASVLWEDGDPVGSAFGFLGHFHDGRASLHSHLAGVVAERAGRGHGERWAADHGLRAITWTFDPLVRRNGWFNLRKLGARAVEYHVDFYGALDDDINGSGETDRLLARWEVAGTSDTGTEPTTEVPTPDDIVTLRRTDPTAAHRWRLDMRERLAPLMARNVIVGMNERGDYLVQAKERGS